jgi:hypothetical protein
MRFNPNLPLFALLCHDPIQKEQTSIISKFHYVNPLVLSLILGRQEASTNQTIPIKLMAWMSYYRLWLLAGRKTGQHQHTRLVRQEGYMQELNAYLFQLLLHGEAAPS